MEINNILQGLIYSFNEIPIRNSILESALKKYGKSKVKWKGTYFLDKENNTFREYRKWKIAKDNVYLFTVAYKYGRNRVHFVAFILDMPKGQIVCFDPGHNLYPQGEHKILPIVVNELLQNTSATKKIVLRTACPQKYLARSYGVQYNGTQIPYNGSKIEAADAFCQTWSIFFLKTYLTNKCSILFFDKWCRIPPRYREHFLLQSFVMPCIVCQPILRKTFGTHVATLESYFLNDFWSTLPYQ